MCGAESLEAVFKVASCSVQNTKGHCLLLFGCTVVLGGRASTAT